MAGDHGLAARVPARLTPAEGRKFGLVVGGAFLVLAALLYWREHEMVSTIAGALGGLLVAGGLIVPTRLGPVQNAWMKLAHAISKVTTPVFMGIIFFVVITPAGLLIRMFGRRPLVRPARVSAWLPRGADNRQSNLERQF